MIVSFEDFTLDWDWNTGDEGTTLCQDDVKYCPDVKTLNNMEYLIITAQGLTDGIVQELRVTSISGTGCNNPTTIIDVRSDASNDNGENGEEDDEFWTCSKNVDPSYSWITYSNPVMGGQFYAINMSNTPYKGFCISFGTQCAKTGFFAQGYKANFNASLNKLFSVEWNEATSDHNITCQEDSIVCPDTKTLKNMMNDKKILRTTLVNFKQIQNMIKNGNCEKTNNQI